MGKFAGFLKRVINFIIGTIPNTIAKGVFKLNKIYKDYKPIVDAGIHLGLELAGGPIAGIVGGTIANLGLNKASKLTDKAEWGYNHPGELWSNYNNKTQIIKQPIKSNEPIRLAINERVKRGFTELSKINNK